MESLKNNETLPKAEPTVKKSEERNKNRRRIIIWLIIILLLLLGLFYLFRVFLRPRGGEETLSVNQPTANIIQNITLATSTEAAKRAAAIASSENFDALQINLEGSGTNIFDFGETEILTLNSVASELYSTKQGDKAEIKAVITCQTNKRSYVEVEYFMSGDKDKKVFKDTYLGFNHMLVTPALEPDSVYKYSVSATDLNQTKVYSEQYVFYTGAGNISLVDILGSAVQKVFGWAMGK